MNVFLGKLQYYWDLFLKASFNVKSADCAEQIILKYGHLEEDSFL